MPERLIASFMTLPASSCGSISERAPPKLPIAERTAAGQPPVHQPGEPGERTLVLGDEEAEGLGVGLVQRLHGERVVGQLHQRSCFGTWPGRPDELAMRSRMPFTNADDSSEPYFLDSSIASLRVTFTGTSERLRIS